MNFIQTKNLDLYYNINQNINSVISIITNRMNKINDIYKMKFTNLTLYLFNDKNEFISHLKNKFSISNMPDWIKGLNVKTESFVLIEDIGEKITDDSYNRIIHELIHQNLFKTFCTNKMLPKWLDEGIALYFSEQFSNNEKIKIYKHLKYGEIPNLQTLNENFVLSGGYHLAPSIIEFIIETYGVDEIYKLSEDMNKSDNNSSLEILYKNWYNYLKNNYLMEK